jgi:hypothetical protein
MKFTFDSRCVFWFYLKHMLKCKIAKKIYCLRIHILCAHVELHEESAMYVFSVNKTKKCLVETLILTTNFILLFGAHKNLVFRATAWCVHRLWRCLGEIFLLELFGTVWMHLSKVLNKMSKCTRGQNALSTLLGRPSFIYFIQVKHCEWRNQMEKAINYSSNVLLCFLS